MKRFLNKNVNQYEMTHTQKKVKRDFDRFYNIYIFLFRPNEQDFNTGGLVYKKHTQKK